MARGHPDYLITAGKTASGDLKIDFDFLVSNGTLIGGGGNGIDGTNTRYTVPSGKKTYIFSLTLMALSDGSSSQSVWKANDVTVLQTTVPSLDGATAPALLAPAIPILLNAGETLVTVIAAPGGEVCGFGFAGYEVDE